MRWWKLHLALALVAVVLAGVTFTVMRNQARATGVSGADFTTVNTTVDGTGHCLNGNPAVNCNLYDGKQYVWLSGGPSSAALQDGSYFFAVLDPGGQADPNDGSADNLSSPHDSYTNRTFSISNGVISYSGTHGFDSNLINLMPYNDTSNPGGVYILAICSLGQEYPVSANDCKYDAFKVKPATTPPTEDLVVTKDANPSFQRSYSWSILKSVDKTKVEQVGGSATFNYTVSVSHSSAHDSGWQVSGTIQVFNPNDNDFNGVTVTDSINDPNATCVVQGGSDVTVPGNTPVTLAYTCTYSAAPASDDETNTATASWDATTYGTPDASASFSVDFTFDDGSAGNPNVSDNCVTVADNFNGTTTTLGSPCVGDANPTVYTYSHTIPIPQYNCVSYSNTATFTTNTTGSTGSAGQTVQVCGPAHTGALTMGFWQNKNGQKIISGGGTNAGVCTSGTWLRQFAPFQNLSATASCAQVASYVYNVIKAASAAGTSMNPMLKAQMLATALDVYFSDPGLGGNMINAPQPLGGVSIDLTHICKITDTSSGATCGGTFLDASSVFGANSLTVTKILASAASQSNAGGSVWYGNFKPTQELAKDVFDAINNQVAFGA